jgi:hypothetical protein
MNDRPSNETSTSDPRLPGPVDAALDRLVSPSTKLLIYKVRRRVLAMIVGISLAGVATVSVLSLPVWPVVGVAVAAAAWVMNSMTACLAQQACWGCGQSLQGTPRGEYGAICDRCGSINQD